MPQIFISYRRQDSQIISERIHDKLSQTYGEAAVFLDVADDIPPGSDWEQVLAHNLAQSDILLVVIGQDWERILNERLDTQDFVRYEVERGLDRRGDLLIIPLLVNNATVPTRLPPALKPLLSHQVMRIRQNPDFHPDMQRLITTINTRNQQIRLPRRRMMTSLLLGGIVMVIGVSLYQNHLSSHNMIEVATPVIASEEIRQISPVASSPADAVETPTVKAENSRHIVFQTGFDDRSLLDAVSVDAASDGFEALFSTVDDINIMTLQNTSDDWATLKLNNVYARDVAIEARVRVIESNATFADIFFLLRGGINEYQGWVSMPHFGGFSIWDGQDTTQIDYSTITDTFAEWHIVRFEIIGSQAQLFVDGELIANHDALTYDELGRVGIQVAPRVIAEFDYFTVEVFDD